MKDIEINSKLIISMLFVIILGGALIWAGYNYLESTKEEQVVKDFEGDWSTNANSSEVIEKNQKKESKENNPEVTVNNIFGETKVGFEINNNNPVTAKEGWEKRTYNYSGVGHRAMYYIPDDWEHKMVRDNKNGVAINSDMLQVDGLTKETTYDEFLNKFVESNKVENYSRRTININGATFYVLVEEKYYNAVYEYFCLAKDNYIYYMQMSTSKEKYNQELINSLNEIYSTFRIY